MIGNRKFNGMFPRLSARLLPEDAALLARDCWLDRDVPRPVNNLRREGSVTGRFRTGVRSIYRYDGNGETTSPYRFFAWDYDVDIVKSPIINDTTNRVVWTGELKTGESSPYVRHTSTVIMQGSNFRGPGAPPSRKFGIPAPEGVIAVTLGSYTSQDADETAVNHTWVYTWLSDQNEEGPPSTPSGVTTRGFNTDGTIRPVSLSIPQNYPSERGINRYRVYRSSGGSYELVGQYNAVFSATTPQHQSDTKKDDALGEALLSEDWDPPPQGLLGLTAMTNGILVGFKGRDIYFSVPYQPHAWPTEWISTVNDDIVGMGSYGVNIVIGTKGKPYVVSGTDPSVAAVQQLEFDQPCVSKRSFAWIDRMGLVYASNDGLVLVGPSGGEFVSRNYFDRQDWEAHDPHEFNSIYHDGHYVAFNETQEKTVAFSPEKAPVYISDDTGNNRVKALQYDRDLDKIWVVNNTRRLFEWHTDGVSSTKRSMLWRSRLHISPGQTFNAAQVFAEGEITFRLFGSDSQEMDFGTSSADMRFEKTLTDTEVNRPFRLPATLGIFNHWVYEVEGTNTVYEIRVGSMRDMLG